MNDKTLNTSKQIPELEDKKLEKVEGMPTVILPNEDVQKIMAFAAHINNHLMNTPVQGDMILIAAGLMKEATRIFTELSEKTNE